MESALFLGVVIAAITQLIKQAVPSVHDWLTVIVAFIVGVVIALVDTHIGVQDMTIAEGIIGSLTAIGYASIAKKASGE